MSTQRSKLNLFDVGGSKTFNIEQTATEVNVYATNDVKIYRNDVDPINPVMEIGATGITFRVPLTITE